MRCRNLTALLCIGLSAACAPEGATGSTEIQLTIGNAFGPQDGAPAFEAERVDYRITCAGTTPGSFPIPPSGAGGDYAYDDSVDISGAFEIVDERNPLVWQTIMDLPPGECTASLSVYRNGQITCLGSHTFTVPEDDTTTVNITLFCDLSIDLPDGTGDTDGEFQFDIGNECPKLFDLTAHPYVIPDGETSTLVQVVARDLDGTCGDNCDPQSCTDANPPVCTPGPDPGLTTTLSALVGTFDDPNGALTTYHCDPAFPGPIEICVVVSDGDLDCDKSACIAVDCTDLCEGVLCDDGNQCTADRCDPASGQCVFEIAPDGIACNDCTSTCQSGVCNSGVPFVAAQNAATMNFIGVTRVINRNYANPYDGFTFMLAGPVNANITTYKGVGLTDAILGTPVGDALFLSEPTLAPQTVCGVENAFAGNAGDIIHLADKFIRLIDMTIDGGLDGDILWANSGNDSVNGANGNDLIDGGPGNDFLVGANGNDQITMGPKDGFDSVIGGSGIDRFAVNALLSQLLISPSPDPFYEFDIYYVGTHIAQIAQIEHFDALNGSIDLTACTASVCNLCGNDDLNGGEECDDGNFINGDGCASSCTLE
jgi:cysteine-rich repeat protein